MGRGGTAAGGGALPESSSGGAPAPAKPQARWTSAEFLVYYAVLVWAYYHIFGSIYEANESAITPKTRLPGLKPGWLFGRRRDDTDYQWGNIRSNFPLLVLGMVVFLAASHALRRAAGSASAPRYAFYLATSLGFLAFMHGASVLFLLAIAVANFGLTRALGASRIAPIVTWTLGIAVLYLTDVYSGYRFAWIHPSLGFLDNYQGIYGWHVTFNLSLLRLISFNMDYHWMLQRRHSDMLKRVKYPDYTWRQESHQPEGNYHFAMYLAYLFYVPLYVAGPICTFNAFASQMLDPQRSYTLRDLAIYALRIAFCFLMLEAMTHLFYCFAISKHRLWRDFSPLQMSTLGYITLVIIWLKFLIIWRFFRLWALGDGIETPENMNRCVSNHYSFVGFWRSWHRSFNRWLIRYLYVPLGGKQWQYLNVWVVFTFVAVWHDLSFNLFAWGWMVCLVILPEILLTAYFARPAMAGFRATDLYRHLCAAGGVVVICLMMTANLVGFSVGVDGASQLWAGILRPGSATTILGIFVSLFAAVQVMFEVREEEARRKEATRHIE